ncbi:MAG: DNA polymerase IV [Candidatus Omnitrophica bacterium ADurb.Bin205]|nr:MAG: DNA polymerase IV [Candidatus Omnitrophica bacterium ADurb.Bin205]
MILHIDMDAFFASIEQAINPRLKDKPLIVGSRGSKMHTVVCAASYAAKALGIHSGMPSREAFARCPGLEFVAADQSKYIWTSEQIFELLKGFELPLNYASIDEFQIDLSGVKNPVSLGKEAKERIYANFNITASAGIAKNWLLAKLASKLGKPDGLILIDDSNFEQTLRKTPLDKLCGMGGKTGRIFMDQGLKTCWDLYLKMPGFFNENPGKFEETSEKPKSINHSYTLPKYETNPQVIKAWIRLLSEMVGVRLRQQNLASKTIHLWLSGPEIGGFGTQKTAQIATNDSYEIYLRCLKIMARITSKTPKIRALGVSASQLTFWDSPFLLIEEKRREALVKAFDQINSRFGEGSIYPAQVVFTHSQNRRLKAKNPGKSAHQSTPIC